MSCGAGPDDENNPLVCFCFNITQWEIAGVIQQPGVNTLFDVMDRCKAGNGCNSCWSLIEEMLATKPPDCP